MRKLDIMGRVCIPKEIRDIYKIDSNTDLQVIDNGNGILILPVNKPYSLTKTSMDTLRRIYLDLKENELINEDYIQKLSKITRETDAKCADCGSNMFLLSDNTYKCYKCE